ncbi:hypothetical protein [Ornithinibacillus halophilus]|uniref:YesK-like protein n=1 Tax=Ornithinibacillus halophilus TaxID=930117 RepID=A0A1M5MZV8_9BACI|nr:hypothetical protein [Ornithinibacillus halophilus]SHG82672.1 hypothetical protein SAMN05216225_10689 [Ornithinibacillus halophilus]
MLGLFIAWIVLSLTVSLFLGLLMLRKTDELKGAFLTAVIANFITLSLAGIWWFRTETDGISQVLGVLYYGLAVVIISIINWIVLRKSGKSSVYKEN